MLHCQAPPAPLPLNSPVETQRSPGLQLLTLGPTVPAYLVSPPASCSCTSLQGFSTLALPLPLPRPALLPATRAPFLYSFRSVSKEYRGAGPVDDAGVTADRARGYGASIFRESGEVGGWHADHKRFA